MRLILRLGCVGLAMDKPAHWLELHRPDGVLVEHPGPWPFHALEADGVVDVVPGLVEATRAVGGRTFLIRRPGRQSSSPVRASYSPCAQSLVS